MFLNTKKPVIRKVIVQKRAAPSPPPSNVNRKAAPSQEIQRAKAQNASRSNPRPYLQPNLLAQKKHLQVQKDESRKRKTTPSQVLSSDSESSEDDDEQVSSKRARFVTHEQRHYDMKRRIWRLEEKEEKEDGPAAVLLTGASLVEEKLEDFQPAFTGDAEISHVKLRYPGSTELER